LAAVDEETTLKADPADQERLLGLAELDTRADVLRTKRAKLPQEAELSENRTEQDAVDATLRDLQIRVDDLSRAQRKSDADVEQVKSRKVRDQQRIDSGAVTNPKDLEHLQHELVSLDRRISELEDIELEVMEELETAQKELAGLTSQAESLKERADALARERDELAAELDDQLAALTTERAKVVDGMPDDLIALYDRIRAQKGGVGAALLRARRCEGCSLELNPADLGVISKAAADEVLRCEECGRILVRTAESGI
jgi:predicted  nucleic acid-binding Zn-ribbon protein